MITEDHLQGHWRRDWIKAPGFEDHTTRVHWMQAGDLFADLRIPVTRPDLSGHSCLADLSPGALHILLLSEGFAGTIDVTDDRCTWRREINWHGVPEADDVGLMYFEGNALMEAGVLAEYRERWLQEGATGMRAQRVSLDDMSGVFVENDAVFVLAMGPSPDTHQPATTNDAAMQAQFTSTYTLGYWQGERGIATLSTNPFCEGQPVLKRNAALVWHALSFD
ncbi:MAG: hypothetical protein AAF214_08425, partial [Pseudomonadota bacterium]